MCVRGNGTHFLLSVPDGDHLLRSIIFMQEATDDLFVMAIECTPKTDESEVKGFLQ
jgi:hypothetical protein